MPKNGAAPIEPATQYCTSRESNPLMPPARKLEIWNQ